MFAFTDILDTVHAYRNMQSVGLNGNNKNLLLFGARMELHNLVHQDGRDNCQLRERRGGGRGIEL